MNQITSKIFHFFSSGDKRTSSVKKNILVSIALKIVSIIISLQVVPLTITYIDPERYGVWLTISSIVAWLAYFDFGFANGFRNKFTEARAIGDISKAKEYVSTTYISLFLIFGIIFIITLLINSQLNWCQILNISSIPNSEFISLFAILASFFCLNMVLGVFTMMLTADQKPALTSLIGTTGQIFAFIAIYLLTIFTQGNLIYLALAFSGIPCVFLLIVSIIAFFKSRYREVRFSFGYVKKNLIKEIIGLGGQFFVIMVSMLFIYQFINIILTRIEGPYAVTQYNIAYKYFNVIFMSFVIILNPFWSATTDAFLKKDFLWMQKAIRKLEYLWLLSIPVLIVMIFFADNIYKWWLNSSVEVPFPITISVAIYVFAQLAGNIYMYILNGTGKVRVQLIIYSSFALIALPIMNKACEEYGIVGILIIPTIVYFLQAIFGKIQLNKIINNKANGIWNK